ncbi:MAG: DUF1648 domain-containing protein [Actinobacteria bacterium]|nr:DUF1648 domain-containing protein [Actinomycetota bacterium]
MEPRKGTGMLGRRVGSPVVMWSLYGLVVLARVASIAWAAARLPERVASHFGPSGAADGWTSREGYLALDIGVSALVLLGFPMLSFLANGSGAGVNIPHKDYWFRPENRPTLRRLLTGDLLFFASATGVLLTWLTVSVVRANEQADPSLGQWSMFVVAAFVLVIVVRSVWMVSGRYRVPATEAARL